MDQEVTWRQNSLAKCDTTGLHDGAACHAACYMRKVVSCSSSSSESMIPLPFRSYLKFHVHSGCVHNDSVFSLLTNRRTLSSHLGVGGEDAH